MCSSLPLPFLLSPLPLDVSEGEIAAIVLDTALQIEYLQKQHTQRHDNHNRSGSLVCGVMLTSQLVDQ